MNLINNLRYLRKRDKLTQEELADQLGVSRQSVSKWETGEAYPDTDKLIAICDFFGISVDSLLRGDLAAEQTLPKSDPEYSVHMDRFSKMISAGVTLILFGVAVCVALAGISMNFSDPHSDLIAVSGGIAVILFVAVAVFLFVYAGINHDSFQKEHPAIEFHPDDKQLLSFQKRFPVIMACLISAILLDVVFLVVFAALIDAQILKTSDPDAAICYVTAVFLFLLSLIVGGLVYYGIQHSKFDVPESNGTHKDRGASTPRAKLKDALCGTVMLSATAIFLLLGFLKNWWHPAWVVFPVGGILCGIISTLMGVKDGNDRDDKDE